MASQEEREYISSFLLQIKITLKPDAITTCFVICTFNLCKTKAQQIKVEISKRKHETAKCNYLTLLSCKNAKTIVSC